MYLDFSLRKPDKNSVLLLINSLMFNINPFNVNDEKLHNELRKPENKNSVLLLINSLMFNINPFNVNVAKLHNER